jgi:hypothetical protein
MDEISIVKKRTRVWPIVLTILLLAIVVLAVLWFMGNSAQTDLGWHDVGDQIGRRGISGIA